MSSRFEQPLLPGILLGIGLGGFVDGIVLHQILQWHHLLTSQGDYPATTVAGLETNTLWDGLFHASTWIACVVGLALLWRGRGGAPPGRALFGQMLAGWGLFNVVEGLVDHQLLGIHHVKTDAAGNAIIALDIAFLLFGAALIATGAALARRRAYSPASGLR
jgi:uncharacterized membrane protein